MAKINQEPKAGCFYQLKFDGTFGCERVFGIRIEGYNYVYRVSRSLQTVYYYPVCYDGNIKHELCSSTLENWAETRDPDPINPDVITRYQLEGGWSHQAEQLNKLVREIGEDKLQHICNMLMDIHNRGWITVRDLEISR